MVKNVFYGWWIVLACFLINLYVGGVAFFGFTAFFEPIQRDFGWNYTQISFASSLRGLEMGIFAPLVGYFVDRLGARKLLLVGSITIGFGLLLLSLTRSLSMFYASFLLVALGAGGCTSVVCMTAVADWFHKKLGLALGIMASGMGAGGLLVLPIVRLIDLYGWRTTLIIMGLGMWIVGIPLSLIVRNSPKHQGLSADIPTPEGLVSDADGENLAMSFRKALRHRSFLYMNVVEAIRMIGVTAVVTHVMPYFSSLGIARATSGLVAAAIPLVSIVGRLGFGWFADIFDKKHVYAATFSLLAAGGLAFCYVRMTWVVVLFVLLFSLGFGGSMVVRGAILREYFGRASFGKMLGIMMGSASVGGVIGPTLAGWIFDDLGSYTAVWLILFGAEVLATVLILGMKPVKAGVPLQRGIGGSSVKRTDVMG